MSGKSKEQTDEMIEIIEEMVAHLSKKFELNALEFMILMTTYLSHFVFDNHPNPGKGIADTHLALATSFQKHYEEWEKNHG